MNVMLCLALEVFFHFAVRRQAVDFEGLLVNMGQILNEACQGKDNKCGGSFEFRMCICDSLFGQGSLIL